MSLIKNNVPSTDLTFVTYQNSGTQSLAPGIATSGIVFAPGEMPAGARLTASIGGTPVAVQLDTRTTHADGSIRMAMLSLARPEIAAGASFDATLSRAAAGPAPAALDLGSALAGHSFDIGVVSAAGTTSVDVLAALRDALAQGSASFWQSGPLATQARIEVPLAGSQRLVFDVTAFANGGLKIDAQFNNDRAMEAGGGRAAYSLTASLDGRLVASETLDQGQYQNWHRTFSTDARNGGQGLGDASQGWLNIRHDMEHLEDTGAIAQYNQAVGVAPALLDAYAAAAMASDWAAPLAANGVTRFMPATGGRADIGFTTTPNTAWLISQDIRAAEYALGQAEAAGAIPWHHWDAAHRGWLSTDHYPRLWTDQRGGTGTPGDPASSGLTQQPDAATGWSLDAAHQPDLSYVPYLLTGERWMLDNLQAQAAWNVVAHWPLARGQADDLVVRDNQVRGAAWSLRQIDEAAWASPDGSPEKAYFSAVSAANWSWLVAQIPAWTVQQGEAHGWLPGDYGTAGALPPWQQDYFAATAIAAARHGNADALTWLEWASNFLVGRFTHAAQGFAQHDGAAYLIAIGDATTGRIYQSWAEIGAAQAARGWSNGTSWSQSQGDYPQLALATLAGIAEVTGSSAATNAYRALLAQAPPFTATTDFNRDPTYAIEAPGNIRIIASAGTSSVSGGAGSDTLIINGARHGGALSISADAPVSDGPAGAFVSVRGSFTGPRETTTFTGIETLSFTDGRLTFDPGDVAFQTSRLYEVAFNRAPDPYGLNSWIDELSAGTSLASVARGLLASSEFRSSYGEMPNDAFVTALYQNALGRAPDAPGLAFWTNSLAAGAARETVLLGFAESAEFRSTHLAANINGIWDQDGATASIARLYQATLNRRPDEPGLHGWRSEMDAGKSLADLVPGFTNSVEFAALYGATGNQAFVTLLYNNVLGRAPDAAGLAGWVAQLDAGGTRTDVVLGFSESLEFRLSTMSWIEGGITFA